ncbi:MAG: hypothetical protein KC646_07645 [Candidatus Cloacimonetes bacterium]|nr:hypothetical protein [Candidatus Cloacimonadota bacterium]
MPYSLVNKLKQKGIALPLAIALGMVVISIAVLLFQRARQNVNVFQYYTGKEKSYYLSQAGQNYAKFLVNKAINELNVDDSTINETPEVEAFKEWMRVQLSEDAKAEPYLVNLDSLDGFLDKNEKLNVAIYVSDWGYSDIKSPYSLSKLKNDEFQAKVKVQVKAEIESKDKISVSETVSYTHIKKSNIIPSILAKFVLYVKSQNGTNFNEIRDSGSFNKVSHTPIMIYSGQEKIRKRSSPRQIAKQIEKAGWIYLGQNDWEIYASQIGNNKSYQDAYLGGINFKPIPEDTVLDLPDAKYISMIKGFYGESKIAKVNQSGALPYNVLTLDDRYPSFFSSDLNLFGNKQEPHVTMIFGSVSRKFIQLSGVFVASVGKILYLPYLQEEDFEAEQWPVSKTPPKSHYFSNTFKNQLKEEGHEEPYKAYKAIMSQIVSEPINRAVLSGLRVTKSYPFNYKTNNIPKLSNLISKKQNLSYHQEASENSAYTILNDEGRPIVDNIRLQDIDIDFLKSKVSKAFNTEATLLKSINVKEDDTNISGVLSVEGDLTISQKLKIKKYNGGIIIVDGNIRIKKNIECLDDELLTLISLNGSIKLDNGVQVDAGLVALNGSIDLPMQFEVYGLVAGASLNLTKPSNRGYNRVIRYNKSFDPSDVTNYKKQYRISYEEDWSHYVR